MYVMVDTEHSARLVEMTRKEYLDIVDHPPFDRTKLYSSVSFQRAHEWVKQGGLHETNLYTDSNGRIRRARCPEAGGY